MKPYGKNTEKGFTIVELMVAITIGLLVLAVLLTIFVNNSRARNEIEKSNRQTESGRYAIELLSHELRNAGYYAEFNPQTLAVPASLPDPCAAADAATLKAALPLHVQGVDNATASPGTCGLTGLKSGTDILVIRRATGCVAGTTDASGNVCDAPANVPYFQASLCNSATELVSANLADHYALEFGYASASLNRHKRDCITTPPGTVADKHRYRTDIYYVASNNEGSDGVPTLKRAELVGVNSFNIVPLVEGVEDMQIEYGVDSTSDGLVDAYMADPGSTANWRGVVALKLHLLARNIELTAGHSDNKIFTLGLKANGTLNTAGPFNDAFKRHVFQSSVRLNNPAGRSATQ